MRERTLAAVSVALLVFWVVGTIVAIDQGWPAEFGTLGDPRDVSGEWMSRGTLVSAPLAPIVAQLAFTVLLLVRGRRLTLAGAAGLALLGVLYAIGGVGEPLDPERSDPPVAAYAAFRLVGLALALALLAGGVAVVRMAMREPRTVR